MFKNIAKIIAGDPSKQAIEEYAQLTDQINKLEPAFEALSDEALRAKTAEFRERLAKGESLDDLLVEAFAAVREASKRGIGQRPYDVQLMGGVSLHRGNIAEMRTGEGKTLVATMPLYLNALTGRGVHLVTVNDYLARRDARWMGPIYDALGMSVGVLQMGSRTEGGRFGYLIDLKKESAHEDQNQLELVERAQAYAADITYGTNNEFGFDYLRDNMRMTQAEKVQRGHYYAIIDEVDNVLIDEARTPLIISGPAHDEAEHYVRMAQIVKRLNPEDYEINEKDRNVSLTEMGEAHMEQLLGVPLSDPERPEDVSPEQARQMGFVEQAMRAQHLFRRNKDYLVQGGQVVIVDEFTGRLMPGRRWSDGLHQAVEAKEGVKVESENVTYATITIQNYFRMYEKLAGMTGTALTEGEEFNKIYKLEVVALPSNVEYNASRKDSPLIEVEGKDEEGYRYNYFTHRTDAQKLPVLWRRKDYPDVVFRTEEAKLRAIVLEIFSVHVIGRPILVGTTSVERSDLLSNRLHAEPIQRLLQTLLLRDAWLVKNNKTDEGFIIPELQFLYEPLDKLNVAQLRQMGRDLGLQLNLQSEENLARLIGLLDLQPEHQLRLLAAIQGGVPHQVLNARKHTEESQIIAGAGAFGAVTIATNMAGRGVDIKLGGEIAEEVLTAVSRVLRKAGHVQPYDMSYEEQKDALLKINPEDYGIYRAEIEYFLKSVDEMAKVKVLGGLHVIGSERHEARRIDNQLRGRSARQGDPGSSRFYLSLQDDLMRLFGGEQVENAMKRMRMDDAVPLEYGLVTRIIEQSQTRVEGANFDARKHLLEYDDVLNSQRATFYGQRDRIMIKEDLTDDVLQMLEEEVRLRVPVALADADGPWKLLAWLEQVQPTLLINRVLVPSFVYQLMLDHLKEQKVTGPDAAQKALVDVAFKSLEAEEQHLLHSLEGLLESSQTRLESQLDERLETIDTFMQGLRLEEEGQQRSPSALANELGTLLLQPLKLDNAQQKLLREDPEKAADLVYAQVSQNLRSQAVVRLIGALERRLEIELNLKADDLAKLEWNEIGERLNQAVNEEFKQRRERLVGEGGQISKEIGDNLASAGADINDGKLLQALVSMPESRVTSFDKKSHQQVVQRRRRLSLAFYAAKFLERLDAEDITEKVLTHLQNAQRATQTIWGMGAWESVASHNPAELNEAARDILAQAVGAEGFEKLNGQPLSALADEAKQKVIQELGRRTLNESYRQLLLRVISELWVDYLTRMEALRISVSLEAYAQRDPLVEYKAQAYKMFQDLFADMRSSLVNRMFIFAPSAPGQAQQAAAQPPAQMAGATNGSGNSTNQQKAPVAVATNGGQEDSGKRKRKRHKKH
jgi:preprotein translocase subunit SecA